MFGVYGFTLSQLNQNRQTEASLKHVYMAGFAAGLVSSFPKNPFELLKIQLQTHGILVTLASGHSG